MPFVRRCFQDPSSWGFPFLPFMAGRALPTNQLGAHAPEIKGPNGGPVDQSKVDYNIVAYIQYL